MANVPVSAMHFFAHATKDSLEPLVVSVSQSYVLVHKSMLGYFHCFFAGVVINIAPKFVQQPVDQSVALFHPINFTCSVTGVPTPTITWYKDGMVLAGQGLQYLYIGEMQLSDRGFYMCAAVNDVGSVTSGLVIANINGET